MPLASRSGHGNSFQTQLGAGTIFSVVGAKIGEKHNFMQYVFFRKRYMRCIMGSGAKLPEAGSFQKILC